MPLLSRSFFDRTLIRRDGWAWREGSANADAAPALGSDACCGESTVEGSPEVARSADASASSGDGLGSLRSRCSGPPASAALPSMDSTSMGDDTGGAVLGPGSGCTGASGDAGKVCAVAETTGTTVEEDAAGTLIGVGWGEADAGTDARGLFPVPRPV